MKSRKSAGILVAAMPAVAAQAQVGLTRNFYANQDATSLVDPLSNL